MIKAVLFDFDGTISNRQYNAYSLFKDYFRKYFPDKNDMEFEAVLQDMMVYDCNGTIDTKYRVAPFMRKYGKDVPEDFEEVFVPFYYQYMYKYCVVKNETHEVLKKLRDSGKYKMAIISNGNSKSQHDKIDYVDVAKYFDVVMVGGDIDIQKPDRRVFDYVTDKLGVRNEECIFVGDVFSTDILGAYNAGMIPVWMKTDPEKPHDFYDGYIIDNLNQLFEILEKI
ncbi:MAG: HAD family hydrolase [Erysipelotrichaceae bacterium]|nr:HAD family hydrolase [Erysipelotrichaceae bacterium]